MDFLENRMRNKQERMSSVTKDFSKAMNPLPIAQQVAAVVQQEIKKIPQVIVKGKKKKFVVADNKDEIINDIIDNKPSYPDVRKALRVYVDKSVEESTT